MHTSHVFIRDVLPARRRPATPGGTVTARSLPWTVTALASAAALPIAGALEEQAGLLRGASVLRPDAAVGAGVLVLGLLVSLWYAATGAALLLSLLLRRELGVARWGAPVARRLALGAGFGLLAVAPAHAEAPDDLTWGAITVAHTTAVAPAPPDLAAVSGPPAGPTSPQPTAPPTMDAGTAGPPTHVVVAGECLWEIAEAELPSPTNRAVAERVDSWIEANPDLAANPDLIHPGDILVVPSGAGR